MRARAAGRCAARAGFGCRSLLLCSLCREVRGVCERATKTLFACSRACFPSFMLVSSWLPCRTSPFATLGASPSPPPQAPRPGTFNYGGKGSCAGCLYMLAAAAELSCARSRAARATSDVAAMKRFTSSSRHSHPHPHNTQTQTMALAGLADYGSSSEDEEEQQKVEEPKLEVRRSNLLPLALPCPSRPAFLSPINSATTASASQEEELAALGQRPLCVHRRPCVHEWWRRRANQTTSPRNLFHPPIPPRAFLLLHPTALAQTPCGGRIRRWREQAHGQNDSSGERKGGE